MSAAFEKLTGRAIPIRTYSGDTENLNVDSVVIVDPSSRSFDGKPCFELADISRTKLMSQSPDGGDSYSGIAATGGVSRAFVDLMKSVRHKLKLDVKN